ncbi:MAG TPA: response regulator [Desulfotignum sp.]|nr:response regulator [Desulfotignum sp.]
MNTILIVDDIKVNLKVLEVLLTRNGYAVLSAASAGKALGLLQENPCDLIVSDIHMPEMDGFQFCRLCKLDDKLKHIPFIFYSSSHTDDQTREQARKLGAHAVVQKPADPATLLKTIDAILSEDKVRSMVHHPGNPAEFLYPCKEEADKFGRHTMVPAEQKQFYNRLLDNLPGIVWTLDAKGDYKYISPAVERLTGFSENRICEMEKNGWLNRVHPADTKKVRAAFKSLFQDHAALDIFYRFECRNGKLAWFHEISGTPYEEQISGRYHVDGLTIDISARMLDQEYRMKSREQEVVNTFSKGVSHDLTNLLAGITDYIQLSAMASTETQERQRFLTNALDISRSAQALIRDISLLSKKEKPVDKNSLFTRVVASVILSLLEGSDIKYRFEMAGKLWPCRVDSRLMTRALEHVIVNACESVVQRSDGFIEVILQNTSIENETGQNPFGSEIILGPGRYIRTTIRDNGCGIDDRILHQIFHPYFSSKARDMKKGVGLSLALSRAIIVRHGGEMTVHSNENHGTEMEIFLPAETES